VARWIALWMLGIAGPGSAFAQDDAEPSDEAGEADDGADDDTDDNDDSDDKPTMSAPSDDEPPADEPKPSMSKPAADDGEESEADEADAEGEGPSMAKPEPADPPTMSAPDDEAGGTTVMTAPMALPPPPPPEDELPIPTLTIDRIPPNTSYEFAVQVSYGQVSYFRDDVPPWVGFGLRGAWGKNFGLHRIAGQLGFTTEGDMGVHTLLVAEPAIAYDVVTPFGLQVGASAGPAIMYWADASTQVPESDFGFGPSAALRVGWSQTWTRIGRRLFVFAEPKLRIAGGNTDLLVAVAVGSGAGR